MLTDPGVIATEVARQRSTDTSGTDVAALDRRLLEIERQWSNLARSLALFDAEETSAPVMAELRALTPQAKVLVAERTLLADRVAESERDRGRLQSLAGWCDRVAGNLAHLSYSEKGVVLDALGVRVKVYRVDHNPRWEMTMEPLPLNTVPDGIAYTSPAG